MYTRHRLTCDVCHGKGTLWLGGADHVECPQCEAKGVVEAIQEVVKAHTQERYIPSFAGGYRKETVFYMPNTGWSNQYGPVSSSAG